MPEMSPDSPPAAVLAQPWAVRLGAIVLGVFAVVVALGFRDAAHRRQLEVVSETTAVGDAMFLPAPDPARLPLVAATLDGRPLFVASAQTIEVRDSHTRRVGHDAAAGVQIYTLSAAATDADRQALGREGETFLLKAATGRYFVARQTAK